MNEAVFTLSRPPTTNELWFNNARGGRSRTQKYNAWRKNAGWEILAQKVHKFIEPVSIAYDMEDAGKFDTDGLLKALNDILVTQRIIPADTRAIVRSITLRWSDLVTGVRVTIRPAVEVPF